MQGQMQDQYGMENMDQYAADPKKSTRAAGVSIFTSKSSTKICFFDLRNLQLSLFCLENGNQQSCCRS